MFEDLVAWNFLCFRFLADICGGLCAFEGPGVLVLLTLCKFVGLSAGAKLLSGKSFAFIGSGSLKGGWSGLQELTESLM